MKFKAFAASFAVLLFVVETAGWAAKIPATPTHWESPHKIRVRLAEALPQAQIRGYDLKIFSGGKLAQATDRVSEWSVHCQEGRVRAIASDGVKTLDLAEPVEIKTPGGFVSFHGKPYRETLVIHSVGSYCEVVNELDLEKYLDGLVNAEFSSRWSEEAISAQVIAARTYALYQMRQARFNQARYDLDSTTRDQVYDGSMKEDYRASRAVALTRGQVLMAPTAKGKFAPIKAFYHSTCGGMTELPENVWGKPFAGFRRRVTCGYCNLSPRFKWEIDLKPKELEALLLKGARKMTAPVAFLKLAQVGEPKLKDLKVVAQDRAGRATWVETDWLLPNGVVQKLTLSSLRLREWIGSARFRSTAFRVFQHLGSGGERRWFFEGKGNGHGVGLCQWGAKTMGEKGFKTSAILSHYYPDAVLQKIW